MEINYRNKNINQAGFYAIILSITVIGYMMYLLFSLDFNGSKDYTDMIYVFSWLGVTLGIYVVYTWYKLTGSCFSLHTILMLFFFLFNYGQPLMWALGIHSPNEIGTTTLYTLGLPTSGDIVYTQALTLICILMFHCGAIFCYKPRKRLDIDNEKIIVSAKKISNAMYYTCLIVCVIVIPITMFNSIYNLIFAQIHGYSAIYYSDDKINIVIFNLIDKMFFPCLVGLLIGSNYQKKIRYFVYSVFSVYLMVNLLSGDRGSWVINLIILIWMSHTFYKRINFKKTVLYTAVAIISLHIVDAIVSVRNIGVNLENISKSLIEGESVITSAIFEMGSSMKPAMVLIKYDWDIWPYTNSYLNAVLGIVSSKVFTILGIPFSAISDWFSQEYLGISYGAGFSIVAEAVLNFGPLIAPIIMIIIGYIITSMTFITKNTTVQRSPMKIFFAISTMSIFVPVVRNHFQWILKSWFYGVFILIILMLIVKDYIERKGYSYNK
ncbi:O-antigen polysaccharide polymerase Wzy [Bacillus paranthracis]|uniref:O-antigen polysaccharide polymerase Wzy n=1 Tax=Bacillus paranthracis TaxID=2026186 RepID=UPI0013D37E26|nr:O-antigen polysaccharide polymerase Wzy [Bacillus paranthracis]